MIKIVAIQSPNGVLITDNVDNQNYFNTQLASKIINGNIAKKSFHKDWFIVEVKRNRADGSVGSPHVRVGLALWSHLIPSRTQK